MYAGKMVATTQIALEPADNQHQKINRSAAIGDFLQVSPLCNSQSCR
jgi:hypothetical protein